MDAHDLVIALKEMYRELGRMPTRAEFEARTVGGNYKIRKLFGNWDKLVSSAGLPTYDERRSGHKLNHVANLDTPPGKRAKFKYEPAKVDPNAFQNALVINLKELFGRAGNPPFLSMIAIPDVHVEHMDRRAVNCAIELITRRQPDLLLFFGDFLNAGGLSHWPGDSLHEKRIVPEIKRGRELLARFRAASQKIVWAGFLEGNHEDWIRQFMCSGVNPQLFDGLPDLGFDISTASLLNLKELGFQFFKVNQIIRIGKAAFTHGMYTGDNHPKQHLIKAKGTIFYGHCHDDKSYIDTSMDGAVEAQSSACLCDLNPSFLRGRLNNWRHGVMEFCIFPNGDFIKTMHHISKGRIVINGKLFQG